MASVSLAELLEGKSKRKTSKRKRSSVSPPRRKSSSSSRPDFTRKRPDFTVFRLLCPTYKIRYVIGKGGSVVRSIRDDTGALIKVQDPIPGVQETVVSISVKEVRSLKANRKAAEGALHKEDSEKETENASEGDEMPAIPNPDGDGEATVLNKNNNNADEQIKQAAISPVQDALLRIHTRMCEIQPLPGEEIEPERSSKIARLLVPISQVGCLLGKEGKIIQKLRQDTGAQIRILPRKRAPACALPTDEVVQIAGDLSTVRKALHAISSKLQANPPKDPSQLPPNEFLIGNAMRQPAEPFLATANMFPQGNLLKPHMDLWHSFSPPRHANMERSQHPFFHPAAPFIPDHGMGLVETLQPMELNVRFRMLCPKNRIGSIIGQGGHIIRILREETGTKIDIEDTGNNFDEHIVHISTIELADENISRAQGATMRIQSRIAELGQDKDGLITTKLLVPSDQVGCLIGKGGTVIAEMRKETRASIKIYGKGQFSSPASETDELVQITGDLGMIQDALFQVTTRLRDNMIHERFGSGSGEHKFTPLPGSCMHGGAPTGNFISPIEGLASAVGRLPEPFSSERHFYTLSDSGLRANNPRPPSPRSWIGESTAGGDSSRLQPHPDSGNMMRADEIPLITSTTVEVVVPEIVLNSIVGPSGNNLAQIREISGANVRVCNLLTGATERTIEISGTPDQTHAAQSLLQAFIFSGQ